MYESLTVQVQTSEDNACNQHQPNPNETGSKFKSIVHHHYNLIIIITQVCRLLQNTFYDIMKSAPQRLISFSNLHSVRVGSGVKVIIWILHRETREDHEKSESEPRNHWA